MSSPNPGNIADQLFDVFAISGNNIWAAGSFTDTSNRDHEPWTLLEHWNGTSWTVAKSASEPNQYLTDLYVKRITGSSPSDLWTVGDGYGSFLEHWNGHTWSTLDNPLGPQITYLYGFASISALSPTDAWGVGSGGSRTYSVGGENTLALTAHWDGHTWSMVPNPDLHADLNGTVLNDVVALAPNNVWAVGRTSSREQGEPALIEHWDGKAWSVVPNPQPQGTTPSGYVAALWSLSALSPNDIWAAGFYESAGAGVDYYLVEHWDGHAWNLVPIPTPAKKIAVLYQILAVSDQNIWVVDADGSMLHWNGSAWKSASLPDAVLNGYQVSRLAVLPNGQLWLVGTVRNPTGPGPRTLIARSC